MNKNTLVYSGILASYLGILLIYFSIPVNAFGPVGENGLDLIIKNNTIEIKGYTIVAAPPYGVPSKFVSSTSLFINPLNESLGGSQVCDYYNYTSGNQTISTPVNCSYNINYVKEIPFLANFSNQTVTTITDVNTQSKYEQCILERAQYSTSYNNCLDSKNKLADFEKNFTTCSAELTNCNNQLSTSKDSVASLTKQNEGSKNDRWIYGLVGLAAGAGAAYYFTNKNSRIKHPEENFNRGQAA